MKIGILGAGGTGSLVGYFLHKAGTEVWLIDINREHIAAVREHGLEISVKNAGLDTLTEETVAVNAVTNAAEAGVCDLVIILTKEPGTKAALESSRALFGEETFILMMQNGIGNEDVLLEYFTADRIGRGVATISGTLYEPGKVRGLYGLDPLVLRFGSLSGSRPRQLVELEKLMNMTDAKAQLSENVMKTVWDKALLNLPTSFVTGIVGVPAPIIIEHEAGRELSREILSEALDVAAACGISYDKQAEIEHYLNESGPTLVKFSSASRDLFCGRVTEVEAINGAIGRLGRRHGIPTPVNDTIANLVRVIQLTYKEQKEANRLA